jgi:hypothetical protein
LLVNSRVRDCERAEELERPLPIAAKDAGDALAAAAKIGNCWQTGRRLPQRENGMQIPILIEPAPGGRFRARSGEPFADCAEGATAEEAARVIEEHFLQRFRDGGIVTITLPIGPSTPPSPPSFPADELYKTDPSFRSWQELIAANRKREDELETHRADAEREAS